MALTGDIFGEKNIARTERSHRSVPNADLHGTG